MLKEVGEMFMRSIDFTRLSHLDAIHDTAPKAMKRSGMAYEMARDEASHGKAFEGLLKRYFG